MKRRANLPVLFRYSRSGLPYLRLNDVAIHCMVHPGLVHRFVRLGLVDPVDLNDEPEQWRFERNVVSQINKIIRLRNELGINYSGIGVILDLLERIDFLETRIRDLENPF
jgi:MerR family transcriptional regulator/heat shock protein HspR